MPCYGHFSLTMGSSSGFGSTRGDSALFTLAFASAPPVTGLTRPPRVTRRIILQKAHRQRVWGKPHTYAFDCVEAYGFRVYFTPLAGVLFTVPSRYCALSVAACM
jgi:hypothetical protein